MTIQEMFDRAVRGLVSQGWEKCMHFHRCRYATTEGKHCAWGWVDLTLGPDQTGSVLELANRKIGAAATLDPDELSFAEELQLVHDRADSPLDMRNRMWELAEKYQLGWPEGVSQ